MLPVCAETSMPRITYLWSGLEINRIMPSIRAAERKTATGTDQLLCFFDFLTIRNSTKVKPFKISRNNSRKIFTFYPVNDRRKTNVGNGTNSAILKPETQIACTAIDTYFVELGVCHFQPISHYNPAALNFVNFFV